MWFHSCNWRLSNPIVYIPFIVTTICLSKVNFFGPLTGCCNVTINKSTWNRSLITIKVLLITLPLFELWKDLGSLGCHLLKNNWSFAYDINYICTCSATCKGGMQVWVFNLFVCQNSTGIKNHTTFTSIF